MSRPSAIHKQCHFLPIYPKLQHNKDCFTTLWIVICKSLSKYEIMPKIAKNVECTLSYTEKMPFMVQICLTYPKFQSNKDCFTKLWIVACKSLSKYEIIQKIITKYDVDPELYTKNAIFGPNFPHLPNFWRLAYFFKKFSNHPLSFLNLYQHATN